MVPVRSWAGLDRHRFHFHNMYQLMMSQSQFLLTDLDGFLEIRPLLSLFGRIFLNWTGPHRNFAGLVNFEAFDPLNLFKPVYFYFHCKIFIHITQNSDCRCFWSKHFMKSRSTEPKVEISGSLCGRILQQTVWGAERKKSFVVIEETLAFLGRIVLHTSSFMHLGTKPHVVLRIEWLLFQIVPFSDQCWDLSCHATKAREKAEVCGWR